MYWFYNDVYDFFKFFFLLTVSSPFGAVKVLQFFSTVPILFDGKVNLVVAFGRSKFLIVFKCVGKNKRKIMENQDF